MRQLCAGRGARVQVCAAPAAASPAAGHAHPLSPGREVTKEVMPHSPGQKEGRAGELSPKPGCNHCQYFLTPGQEDAGNTCPCPAPCAA